MYEKVRGAIFNISTITRRWHRAELWFLGSVTQIINNPLILPPSVDSLTASLLEGLLEKGGGDEARMLLCYRGEERRGSECFL